MPSGRDKEVTIDVLDRPLKRFKSNDTESFVVNVRASSIEKASNDPVTSPTINAFGRKWVLLIVGDGNDVNFELHNSHEYPGLRFIITISCKDWKQQSEYVYGPTIRVSKDEFLKKYTDNDGMVGITLELERVHAVQWKPDKFVYQPVLAKIIKSKKTADCIFIVEGKKFHLHKCILEARCPKLYEIADISEDKPFVFDADKINSETFDTIIHYVYGVRAPDFCGCPKFTKAILSAACYLQLTNLKLLAECQLASHHINSYNAAEFLLLADSYVCALLKEEAMNVCLKYLDCVKQSSGWKLLQESPVLLTELLTYSCHKSYDRIDCLDVVTLRKELQKRKLEVDGTREMLVNRLRAAYDKESK